MGNDMWKIILEMISDGEIEDAKTIIALLLTAENFEGPLKWEMKNGK